jgi:hypothetical protein
MKAHGIGRILTFNVQDFARFAEIEALHPVAVGAWVAGLPRPDAVSECPTVPTE